MHRSVLLLLMSALLLNVAVGLPLSLEESAEMSWLDMLLEDVLEGEELPDFSHENAIHKRAAKDSSSSSEEHKDKANSASSSEEHKSTTDHAAAESTTQAAARRRRQTNTKFSPKYIHFCLEDYPTIPETDLDYMEEYMKQMCPRLLALRTLLIATQILYVDPIGLENAIYTENAIHKQAAKDPVSPAEEQKANSSGESSSEENKAETCEWMENIIEKRTQIDLSTIHDHLDAYKACVPWLERQILKERANISNSVVKERLRRQVSDQDQQRVEKASGELELDAQAEKELDEEMARAVADVKDNGSIEDYAQGCEVMEVSSKEANEATYAE